MPGKREEIELLSPGATEIISRPPAWLVKYGMLILAGVFTFLLVMAALIRYPDTIVAPVVVTTQVPPANLVARSNGKITAIFVNDKAQVKADALIAALENPAVLRDVLFVDSCFNLPLMKPDHEMTKALLRAAPGLRLGEVQEAFNEYNKALTDYQSFIELGFYQKKIEALKDEVVLTQQYFSRLSGQKNILERDHQLGARQYSRDSMLMNERAISQTDFERSESNLLQKHFSLEGVRVSLANTSIRINQLRQEILDLELRYDMEKEELLTGLKLSADKLSSRINWWKQEYLLVSPVSGIVTFNRYWAVNQYVKSGDLVFSVLPAEPGPPVARIRLPLKGAGKVKSGQKVIIRLDDFPYLEYGILEGDIQNISLVSNENVYLAAVKLAPGLKTNYGTALPRNREMSGQAEVITEEISLLQRLVNPFRFFYRKSIR